VQFEIEAVNLVFLPGFQKGRDIEASYGKGQGAVLAKKRAICIVLHVLRKNLKNGRNSLLLGSIKCFPISFITFKTL
jgi:hypothetical protein